MTSFNKYADYYDLLYKEKDYTSESEYINELIKKYGPRVSHILELGCGTGKHALLLSEMGYSLHCIDKSSEMLEIARQNYNNFDSGVDDSVSFEQCDIREFRSDIKFDVAISLFHVISYLPTNMDLVKTFYTVASSLRSSGLFIFDCWYGPAVLSLVPENRKKTFENDKLIITRHTKPTLLPDRNIVNIVFDIEVKNKETGDISRFTELHPMRYLFTPELDSFLSQTGLTLVGSEEWLTGNRLGADTWNACYIARS